VLVSSLNAFKLGNILLLASGTWRHLAYIARRLVFEKFGRFFIQAGVDAFLCTFPLATCQFWLPFGLPIIAYGFQQFEYVRESEAMYSDWVRDLRCLQSQPLNTVASNNVYDIVHAAYYVGGTATPWRLIPSLALYVPHTRPVGAPLTRTVPILHKFWETAIPDFHLILEDLRTRSSGALSSGHRSWEQVAKGLAVVLLPYHKSTMQFFELYRMNVPIFVPSVQFLVDLAEAYQSLLPLRVLHPDIPQPEFVDTALVSLAANMSTLEPSTRPMQPSAFMPDDAEPNRRDDVTQWVKLADYYQFPFVQYFHSWMELATFRFEEERSQLDAISRSMRRHNSQRTSQVLSEWDRTLQSVRASRIGVGASHAGADEPRSYEDALRLTCGFEEHTYSFHLRYPAHANLSLRRCGHLHSAMDRRKARENMPEAVNEFCQSPYDLVFGDKSHHDMFFAEGLLAEKLKGMAVNYPAPQAAPDCRPISNEFNSSRCQAMRKSTSIAERLLVATTIATEMQL
jgi:hypothetical protein